MVSTPAANAEQSQNSSDSDALAEQLVSLYADLDYMTGKYANHSIRSIADYCQLLEGRVHELQKQLATRGNAEVTPHGIVPANVFAALPGLDARTADEAPLGIVEVDDKGIIKIYNRYESELAGVQQVGALGKNFFLDVAPCTNNKLFFGRFRDGIASGFLDVGFNYTFTYKMKPTSVSIHIYRDTTTQRNFVFVSRR